MASLFGRTLRYLREQKKLTGYKLAAMTGAERTVLSRIEAGERDATDDIIRKIAPALGVSPVELKLETFEDIFGQGFEGEVRSWLERREAQRGQRTSPEFWKSLTPMALELEVARLLREHGYTENRSVGETKVEVDLRYTRKNLSGVAEIKVATAPVDGKAVKDLDLKRQLAGAAEGLFVAPGGFSGEALEVAKKVQLKLLNAEDLATMAAENSK